MAHDLEQQKALILVDLQNDFCAGGALAVFQAEEIIPLANQLQPRFQHVIATQDWHPASHKSFVTQHTGRQVGEQIQINAQLQTLWPVHCVQQSKGAAFHPQLNQQHIERIFQKGIDPSIDSYSGFYDNGHLRSTGLAEYLHEIGVDTVYILGLATDYCVKYTVLDALAAGFKTYVITDACRAVGLSLHDEAEALKEMHAAGAHLIHSKALLL